MLATYWPSMGGIVAWLRSTQPLTGIDKIAGLESLQFGLLLFGLYLLTGALVMATAYRSSIRRCGAEAANDLIPPHRPNPNR
ncbi:MAG: hypothetical protein ACRDTA_07775 [Pseudonocardiaceae bacterium]